jgi:YbgC/YbaW family acyl-CoA thioester hydrolase
MTFGESATELMRPITKLGGGNEIVETGKIVKKPCSKVKIRFQDCDPFGHLNNARYIDYFINAREEHLALHYGLDIYTRQKQLKENWLITKHQIAYVAPVVFREEVLVTTCLLAFTEDSVRMEGTMWDSDGKLLKSVLRTEFKYFSFATRRVAKHPADIMRLFAAIVEDGEGNHPGFDARVESLRSRNRLSTVSMRFQGTDSREEDHV